MMVAIPLALVGLYLLRKPWPDIALLRRGEEGDSIPDGMRYPHHCPKCTPVEQIGQYDMYFHADLNEPMAVARYGDLPGDYIASNPLVLTEIEGRPKEIVEINVAAPPGDGKSMSLPLNFSI